MKGATAYTVAVESERDETGPFTLQVEFHADNATTAPLTLNTPHQQMSESGDTDYFYFEVTATQDGLLILETTRHEDQTAYTPTRGTLYGPDGLIAMDDNSAGQSNFKLAAPSAAASTTEASRYIIQVNVQGRPGDYALNANTDAADPAEFMVSAEEHRGDSDGQGHCRRDG